MAETALFEIDLLCPERPQYTIEHGAEWPLVLKYARNLKDDETLIVIQINGDVGPPFTLEITRG